MGFETAKSAIFTNQKSIDIVGNNLANIDTKGYSRQRVDTASIAPSAYSTRVASSRTGVLGQGVETLGVSQMRDSFLDKRFRDEYAQTSYHGQASDILGDIQAALGGNNITSESGLLGAMQQLFNALTDYSSEPTLDTQANLVKSAFQNIAQVLQQLDSKLTGVVDQQTYDTGVTVDRVNEISAQIANLNKTISGDSTVLSDPDNEYFRPNELLDQRNVLLDELAGYGDITVTELSNGSVNVTMGGHALVTQGEYVTMGMTVNDDDTIAFNWRDTGEHVLLSGGSLLASLQFINGRGKNVQNNSETPEEGIPYYRDKLDEFANALAYVANHTVPELDADTGKPKIDPVTNNTVYKTLVAAKMPNGSTNAKVSVTASNISISDEWNKGGSGYFIYDKDARVPEYAQQLISSLTIDATTFKSYGETFTGTFEDYFRDVISKLGADLNYHEGRQEATALIADDFLSRRDEISAVSRDEETANMLVYQKSYEAAARLMTTLDDLLDVVINRMGRAGL